MDTPGGESTALAAARWSDPRVRPDRSAVAAASHALIPSGIALHHMIDRTLGTASTPTDGERPRFFARSALVMALIVVLSFPVTYYLPVATGSGTFDTLHHLHGLAFFAWFGLYVWEARLVARRQVARHREIGLLGLGLTGLMVPLGLWMAQRAAQRRIGTMAHPYEFTWYNLVDISLFAVLMTAAIVLVTRHREWHRRFVFVAALCLVAPAATRWTLRMPGIDPFVLDIAAYVLMYPFLIALALFDWRQRGRLHPATLTSVALVLPFHLSGAWIARSSWWHAVAPGLIGPP